MANRTSNTVLYIDHSAKIGGAAKILMNLIEELPAYGIKPVVVCAAGSDLQTYYERKNVETHSTSMPWFTRRAGPLTWFVYGYSLLSFAFFLRRLARKSQASLIHANGFIAALYAAIPAKLFRVPFIWHMHDILEKGWFNAVFIRLAGRRADRIICVSEAVKARLVEFGVDVKKCRVLYNFIPILVRSDGPHRGALHAEYPIPHHSMIIGMIGNICELKGQMMLIEAVRQLADRHPEAVYVLVGDTNTNAELAYKKELLKLVKISGLENKVIFAGFRKDAFQILGEFDIFVHPVTLPDSLPQVLLEAMHHKKPIIASNIGGIPEIVVDGVSGFLVPPRDPRALAEAIDRLLKGPELRASFGAEGHRILLEKFRRDIFLAKLINIYEELLQVSVRPE